MRLSRSRPVGSVSLGLSRSRVFAAIGVRGFYSSFTVSNHDSPVAYDTDVRIIAPPARRRPSVEEPWTAA